MNEIRELMERWARWRTHRAGDEVGWPKKTVLGKILDGMPSTKCTLCHGKGRITERDVPTLQGRMECPQCAGLGKVKADPLGEKVNPAFIKGSYNANYGEDPVAQEVDRLVCTALTQLERKVVLHEYDGRYVNKTYDWKAGRLNISHRRYTQLLETAVDKVAVGLGLRLYA